MCDGIPRYFLVTTMRFQYDRAHTQTFIVRAFLCPEILFSRKSKVQCETKFEVTVTLSRLSLSSTTKQKQSKAYKCFYS